MKLLSTILLSMFLINCSQLEEVLYEFPSTELPSIASPSMSPISNQKVVINQSTSLIKVVLENVSNTFKCTNLKMTTDNSDLIESNNVVFSGSSPNCEAIVSPKLWQSGSAMIKFEGIDDELAFESIFYITVTTPFVSLWDFPSANFNFTLPLKDGLNYDFEIDWGDGSPKQRITSFSDVDKNHTYVTPGAYKITINGLCEGFQNNGAFANNLIEVIDLASTGWRDLSYAFENNANLTSLSGGKTELVTDMSYTFKSASQVIVDVSTWKTSRVTNMEAMFSSATVAKPNTIHWDTSKVTNMSFLFADAINAQPDTSNWKTENVTNMESMFMSAALATPTTDNWDTINVTNMRYMFSWASQANPNTTNWKTGNVTNMEAMFQSTLLSTPITDNWDTSNVTNMRYMFAFTPLANPNTTNWKTGNVTNMESMFHSALSAQPETGNWNTSKVNVMKNLFSFATLANPNVTNWDTSAVWDMEGLFRALPTATPNTTNWNTDNVETMAFMFAYASMATPNTTNWNTWNVTTMESMFECADNINIDVSNWSFVNTTNLDNFLTHNVALSQSNYDTLLNKIFTDTAGITGGDIDVSTNFTTATSGAFKTSITGAGWNISDGGGI